MTTNKILERIRQGEKALGLSMRFPSEGLVELAARIGLDFVSFDGQHSALNPVVVEQLCRVADGFGITPTMRIPDHQPSTILTALDRGIKVITVPNLETKEQAEALVKYSYYSPKGLRSAAGIRVVLNAESGDRTYVYAVTNENTMVVPQLESITAFENLDEILTVDGIDYFAGGPQDVAQSMGFPGQPDHPQVREAIAKAEEKVRTAGKKMFGDVTEAIAVVDVIKDATRDLLEENGRKSQLQW
jgi:4-hydroxy-2-oxoheptanedioate aldolase